MRAELELLRLCPQRQPQMPNHQEYHELGVGVQQHALGAACAGPGADAPSSALGGALRGGGRGGGGSAVRGME